MPTYDYRCDLCGSEFEVQQSFSDNTLKKCPKKGGPDACVSPGKGPVRKVFAPVGIAFKGDGFYKNDHGAGAKSKASSTATAEASDSSSTTSTETKADKPKADKPAKSTSAKADKKSAAKASDK